MRTFASILLSSILWALPVQAQLWSGVLDPSRAIDWSQSGIPGGIPTRTTICATFSPGATHTQIDAAIAACPPNQVVFLNAGTYNMTGAIHFYGRQNITLRGAGANQTILIFGSGTPVRPITVESTSNIDRDSPGNVANWTSGYAKGTTTITLSDTTNMQVGSLMVLDQLDDDFTTDNGELWVCRKQYVCSTEGDSFLGRGTGADGVARGNHQVVIVTGVNHVTKQVTFTPGLYMPNWRSDRRPGAYWSTELPTRGIGVEDLTIDFTATTNAYAIQIWNCNGCWVKGVRTFTPVRAHIFLKVSVGCVIRDSYFFGTKNAASQSYGVETYTTSGNLIENNIFQRITVPMMTGGGTAGTVYAYNYTINDFYQSASWVMPNNQQHSLGIAYNLYEGQSAIGLMADMVHGTSHFGTVFRSFLTGWEPGKIQQTVPIHVYALNRFFNVIGSVLGTPGFHTNYAAIYPGGVGTGNVSIYDVGWVCSAARAGSACGFSTLPTDAIAGTSLMRWGNYDVVTSTPRFQSSEVPTGLANYANAVPATQTLPNSFYLSAKPSFFGSVSWPPIGPEVAGGDIAGYEGHAHKIPAQLCFENIMRGTFGDTVARPFSAKTCYGETSGAPDIAAPNPPTNLRIS